MNRRCVLLLAALLVSIASAPAQESSPKPVATPPAPTDPAAAEKQRGKEYLGKLDADTTVQKKPSGLRIRIVQPGEGQSPAPTDKVQVHYRGTLADGKEFDSSYKRGAPATFPLNGVIPCWTEGLQLLKPGGKATLYCPPEIAYGDRGFPGAVPPGATLVFDVQLVGIEGARRPEAAPSPAPR